MKEFAVSMDITMSKTIYVKAENEEQAKKLAESTLDAYEAARNADSYVAHSIVDVYEVDE
jgi:hypothetical protein